MTFHDEKTYSFEEGKVNITVVIERRSPFDPGICCVVKHPDGNVTKDTIFPPEKLLLPKGREALSVNLARQSYHTWKKNQTWLQSTYVAPSAYQGFRSSAWQLRRMRQQRQGRIAAS